MKAAVIHAPYDLRIEEREVPAVGPHEIKVRIRAGGICGSDLHYYLRGGFGTVRLQEPFIPGHEVAGEVMEVGAAVTRIRAGDHVAINPSRPCGHCHFCLSGLPTHCPDMYYHGSAMRMPHAQGLFREVLVCGEAQAVLLPPALALETAAFAEPLAVCLHAVHRAGSLLGKRVLVSGSGPIGALVILVARRAGAREIVATDIVDAPLVVARHIGADAAFNVASEPRALDRFKTDKGYFDAVFEASGSGAALASALEVTRPGGVIAQLGLGGGEMTVPMNLLVTKEIRLQGTFRFDQEFVWAVDYLAAGTIDVSPLLTEVVPLAEAVRAFDLAADRNRAMKVVLAI